MALFALVYFLNVKIAVKISEKLVVNSLPLKWYNYRNGTNLTKEEILIFGRDADYTTEDWLGYLYGIILVVLIQASSETETATGHYEHIEGLDEGRFIAEMKESEEGLPEIINQAGKHFFQIIINEEHQHDFFAPLILFAINKGLVHFPEVTGEITEIQYTYSGLKAESFFVPRND